MDGRLDTLNRTSYVEVALGVAARFAEGDAVGGRRTKGEESIPPRTVDRSGSRVFT